MNTEKLQALMTRSRYNTRHAVIRGPNLYATELTQCLGGACLLRRRKALQSILGHLECKAELHSQEQSQPPSQSRAGSRMSSMQNEEDTSRHSRNVDGRFAGVVGEKLRVEGVCVADGACNGLAGAQDGPKVHDCARLLLLQQRQEALGHQEWSNHIDLEYLGVLVTTPESTELVSAEAASPCSRGIVNHIHHEHAGVLVTTPESTELVSAEAASPCSRGIVNHIHHEHAGVLVTTPESTEQTSRRCLGARRKTQGSGVCLSRLSRC